MSITFWKEEDDQDTTTYTCYHCENHAFYDARIAAGLNDDEEGFWNTDVGFEYDPKIHARESCGECGGTGEVVLTSDRHSINLANSNAAAWMALLNMEFDYCGTIDEPALEDWSVIRDRMLDSRNPQYLGHSAFLYFRDLCARWNELVLVARKGDNQLHWG